MRQLSDLVPEDDAVGQAAPGRHADLLQYLPADFRSAWPFWEHLAERLLMVHQQVFRYLSGGSRRHARTLPPSAVYSPGQAQWQASWHLEGPTTNFNSPSHGIGPELFIDLPTEVNILAERWHSRWSVANSPTFLHIHPHSARGQRPAEQFNSAIGIVTVFVPELQFLTLLNTGAWDQPMPSAILASGDPVLIDFNSMIMVRPAGLPMSYLYRVLRLLDF